MSLDKLHNTNREFKALQDSFEHWDTGEPSADVWENLETDLAVSAVWDRLDETLEANGSPADKALVESYENWSPNTSGDGWSKLEEQLSRERVWTRLNTTLSYPVTTRVPWMKMAAASVLFVFLAFYTDRFTGSNGENSHSVSVAMNSNLGSNKQMDRNLASANGTQNTPGETNLVAAQEETERVLQHVNAPNNLLVSNNGTNHSNDSNPYNGNENEVQNNPLVANQNQNRSTENTANTNEGVNASDLVALDQLPAREVRAFGEPGTIGDFEFLPFQAPFRPRFSVLAGGQFSFINEKNRDAFSSSLPSMGLAADVQYHAYLRKWRFTQDLGFSQYAQSNGSYVNGRYTNSSQKLNTIHLMSSVGYTFKGVTISGGIAVNRLLNGYEENRTAITNVYNSKNLQIGATA